jgi:exosortase/archaeosortase family protein
MFLMLLFCLPVGPRAYAALIIRPETLTLDVVRPVLDALPGTSVQLQGADLTYSREGRTGSIALGESHRGVALLGAFGMIGVFVVFAQIRPVWQIIAAAVAAVPIVFLCNFLRILTWGVVSIYAHPSPASAMPRAVAAVVSLSAAYVIFGLLCAMLANLVVEVDESNDRRAVAEDTHA